MITQQAMTIVPITVAKSSSVGSLFIFVLSFLDGQQCPNKKQRPQQDQKHRQEINKEILRLVLAIISHGQSEIDDASKIEI